MKIIAFVEARHTQGRAAGPNNPTRTTKTPGGTVERGPDLLEQSRREQLDPAFDA